MDNAVATTATTSLATQRVPATPGMATRWLALPARLQVGATLGFAGLLAVVVLMFTGARDADYRMLFPNLSDKDGGAVIERLTPASCAVHARARPAP